jgi:hypothetical protein
MKIKIEDSSPDGMTITLKTFLMTYEDIKAFIDWVALLECGDYKKVLASLNANQQSSEAERK